MSTTKINKSLRVIHEQYIRGTPAKIKVATKTVFFCYLTKVVMEQLRTFGCNIEESKVYITVRALKHCYDGKPAEEYDFLLENLYEIAMHPDHIYKNKSARRGNFGFIKSIKGDKYFCSLEFNENKKAMFFVTSFRIRKENYLKDFELLWSWRSDAPSS